MIAGLIRPLVAASLFSSDRSLAIASTRVSTRSSMWHRLAVLVLLLIAASAPLRAQQAMKRSAASIATVTFELDFPESNPKHYSIAVDANGHARYECVGTIAQDSEEQTYRAEFEMSVSSREKIFDWAKQARFFAGNVDSGNGKIAFTGWKVLRYEDGQTSQSAKYNYSTVAAVRQLTALFQNMASTQDYGRRLSYYHHYQKLALDDELKGMEAQARSNELSEIQGVASILQEILDDPSVINGVRARAKALIEMGNGTATTR